MKIESISYGLVMYFYVSKIDCLGKFFMLFILVFVWEVVFMDGINIFCFFWLEGSIMVLF